MIEDTSVEVNEEILPFVGRIRISVDSTGRREPVVSVKAQIATS